MDIKYWTSSSGRNYVGEFINKQIPTAQRVIIADLNLMSQYGYQAAVNVRFDNIKPLQGKKMKEKKINEMVIRHSQASFRVLFVIRNSVCWLLHIFKKETNKTPLNALTVAYKRACDLDYYLANL